MKKFKRKNLKHLNYTNEKLPIKLINLINTHSLINDFKEYYKNNKQFINFLKNIEFYYYQSEQIADFGWGCAWRCFQTLLKTLINYCKSNENLKLKYIKLIESNVAFESLFLKYGGRKYLEKIYLKKKFFNKRQ